MANLEHLKILKQGAEVWNKWREKYHVAPNLADVGLSRVDLSRVDLSRAYISGVNLFRTDLSGANLSGANLSGVDFSRAELIETNLSGANLSRANLIETNLIEANLSGADLTDANLFRADLSGVNLSGANLTGTNLQGTRWHRTAVLQTIFADVDLSEAIGLDQVRHLGPSTIGIDTIYRSEGKIPNVFLHGAGVPDKLISYIPSLMGQPSHFYSCFISYSTENEAFVNRLHTDLRGRGVQCWFAPVDIKMGDKFLQRIYEAISLYDKLLIVLSRESIESSWVEREVYAALEREARDKEKRTVLLPIRLDNAVMSSKMAWVGTIRNSRQIGDFQYWKEQDKYEKAFNRLLHDLKTNAET